MIALIELSVRFRVQAANSISKNQPDRALSAIGGIGRAVSMKPSDAESPRCDDAETIFFAIVMARLSLLVRGHAVT